MVRQRPADGRAVPLATIDGYWAVTPPSAASTAPVKKEPSGPARNSAVLAISSGWPSLPSRYFFSVSATPP